MTAPPKDLETARRLAVEEALKAATPKPSADVVRKGPSSVRIARLARLFIERHR